MSTDYEKASFTDVQDNALAHSLAQILGLERLLVAVVRPTSRSVVENRF